MYQLRNASIQLARKAQIFGVILGTLGRQGNIGIMKRILRLLKEKKLEYVSICASEINQEVINSHTEVECFVQIGCPRLSLDWGHENVKPMLNP